VLGHGRRFQRTLKPPLWQADAEYMRRVRENALCAFMASAGCVTIAWLGLYGFAWSDYEIEAQPAFEALAHGHVLAFLRLAPAYGGSLVERAPFALIPGVWGGGQLAVYRMVALPCLLAAAVLAVWLCAQMRAAGRSTLSRAVVLGICVANPLTLRALEVGHPEELLGACLCVAAMLLSGRGRPVWAGALFGLAIANKDWALLALGPVLWALPSRPGVRRRRQAGICLATAGATAAIILAPLALASPGGFAAQTSGAALAQQEIFQPFELWWFLGTPNHVPAPSGHPRTVPVGAPLSTHPQWRLAPAWLTGLPHPLIIMLALPLTLLAWRHRRPGSPLLLLALLLALRCVLDPWDTDYYALPFIFALLAWELRGENAGPPVLALSSTALAWVSYQWLPSHVSPDAQAAFFLAWTLPLIAALALRLYAPGRLSGSSRRARPAVRTAAST
jgi:hypothetical protein